MAFMSQQRLTARAVAVGNRSGLEGDTGTVLLLYVDGMAISEPTAKQHNVQGITYAGN